MKFFALLRLHLTSHHISGRAFKNDFSPTAGLREGRGEEEEEEGGAIFIFLRGFGRLTSEEFQS